MKNGKQKEAQNNNRGWGLCLACANPVRFPALWFLPQPEGMIPELPISITPKPRKGGERGEKSRLSRLPIFCGFEKKCR